MNIKCNVCNSWVCEKCSDVSINKFKPILNKCKTLHFLCKSCESNIDSPLESSIDHLEKEEAITTIRNLISDGISQIEAKIESTISEKIQERVSNLHSPSTVASSDGSQTTNDSSWSFVVGKSTNIKILIREAKNDEKVENNEREKRSRNIIIHGAEEVGGSPEEIKKEDEQYINDILKEIGSSVKPNFITRLGVKSKDKNRPIKIVLKSKSDKDSVMKNLGRLKGISLAK